MHYIKWNHDLNLVKRGCLQGFHNIIIFDIIKLHYCEMMMFEIKAKSTDNERNVIHHDKRPWPAQV
jgi:hypothetical protein